MSIHVASDVRERMIRTSKEKARKDEVSSLNYAYAQGYAQGYAKGQAIARDRIKYGRIELETKIEISKKLLDLLDDETISDTIGLEVLHVTSLREKAEIEAEAEREKLKTTKNN